MTWQATAPANIALIKYMGKDDSQNNLPSNASLSFTLNNLQSIVELNVIDSEVDQWEPLQNEITHPMSLSNQGQTRFLNHLEKLKALFHFPGSFLVKSGNNFPSDCGLASSASSFAALTKVACTALSELTDRELPSISEQAELSRQASGSSCRSFFSPWSIWEGQTVTDIELPYENLIHQVIVVEQGKKSVSSSQAHQRVPSSLLFDGRIERANQRLSELTKALQNSQWQTAFEICWQEFWDMHALFETAKPPFGYMTQDSMNVLTTLRKHWQTYDDGPLVTMDAGANVHLLFRRDQRIMAQDLYQLLSAHYMVLTSD